MPENFPVASVPTLTWTKAESTIWILFLFADTMEQEKETTGRNGDNHIYLNGFLCKPPYFRIKKTSGRHITDLLLAGKPFHTENRTIFRYLHGGRLADLTAG